MRAVLLVTFVLFAIFYVAQGRVNLPKGGRLRMRPGSCVCPALYKPVCDENGARYTNSCRARCAGATGELSSCDAAQVFGDSASQQWSYMDCISKYCKNVFVCTACLALKPSETSACDGQRNGQRCCWNDQAARQQGLIRC
jgi:hypothetical protein